MLFSKKDKAVMPVVKCVDTWYNDLCETILNEGVYIGDGKRTAEGYTSVHGVGGKFKVTNSLPLLTGKQVFTKGIIYEAIWMMHGDTNLRYLKQHGVNIWDSWVIPETAEYDEDGKLIAGDLKDVYQEQWFNWEGYNGESFNQVKQVIDKLNNANKVNCRRKIISAWNVAKIDGMALAPCHSIFQFHSVPMEIEERINRAYEEKLIEKKRWKLLLSIAKDIARLDPADNVPHNFDLVREVNRIYPATRKLSVQMYQRSCDVALGLPFNLVQYSLFLHIFAKMTNHSPEHLIWHGGDCHLYENQIDGIKEQLKRKPMKQKNHFELHDFRIHGNPSCATVNEHLKNLGFSDFKITDYVSHPPIKFPQAAV